MHAGYKDVERPDWANYFLGLCFFISQRSEDAETQHGCILTDRYNHILGSGYNSLPRGISKGSMPNTRPDKYEKMIHAEENALFNTTANLWLVPEGCICYCTARPCLKCLYRLWNNNIKTIFIAKTPYHFRDYEKEQKDFDDFVSDTGIKLFVVDVKFDWLNRPVEKLKSYGLLD